MQDAVREIGRRFPLPTGPGLRFDKGRPKWFPLREFVRPHEEGSSFHAARRNPTSDPATRELEGLLRRLEGLMPLSPSIHWQESRQRNIEALGRIAAECAKSAALIRRLDGADYEVGGDEHLLIRVEDDPARIYKCTYGDSFGCHSVLDPVDVDLSGKNFNATLNDDPCFYLRRWILLNSLSGFATRYEGVLPPERSGWAPRICVSQPWIEGTNPSMLEIEQAMLAYGFHIVSEGAFFEPRSKLLLTDAAPRNVRIVNGGPVLFDAIAEIASPEVLGWLGSKGFQLD
jgi:hypothetical protein